jgi:hypothetical protein
MGQKENQHKYYITHKEQEKARAKAWRDNNRDRWNSYRRSWREKNYTHKPSPYIRKRPKEQMQAWFAEYKKNLKCELCGYDKCKYALDFHHRDPEEKDTNISKLVLRQSSIKRLQEELAKCICVCANCHRELHYKIGLSKSFSNKPKIEVEEPKEIDLFAADNLQSNIDEHSQPPV